MSPATSGEGRVGAVVELAAGAREAEARLLAIVATHRERARSEPTLLARPLRVLVPSRSLRLHVAERLTAALGAIAGVQVQTLHALAVELTAGGEPLRGGDLLVDLLARRSAAADPLLRGAFGAFQDGYRGVAGAVRDLFDAGFEPEHAGAVLERVDAAGGSADARRRARAVVAVAVQVARALAERGAGGRSELLRRAREALESGTSLVASALVVHGFADATGRAADLLAALARRFPTTVLVDLPPDPDDPSATDLGASFAERLIERFEAEPRSAGAPREPAALELFRAPGPEAEAREVARRVRDALAAGVRPERIGVVARDLAPYRSALRIQLGRLGIPCSGLRARAPIDGDGRRVLALLDLFEARERCPADRWLDAAPRLRFERAGDSGESETVERAPSHELRLGLRVLGAARLADVAALDVDERLGERGSLRLPLRLGVGRSDEIGFHARRAKLRGSDLRACAGAARALARRFASWPQSATLAAHLAELERARTDDLGWRAKDRSEQRVAQALADLAESLGEEELTLDELGQLVRRALAPLAAPALGGNGGGVQVLDAMEARARTFERLFVVGVGRGAFPRPIREDAVLSDDLRRALTDLLPEMPVKARSRDEDRYLFAQLASASPRVTVSWCFADDDGRPSVISPLVERLLREHDEESVFAAPPLYPQERERAASGGPRTAAEHAILGALHAGLDGHERRLALALRESGERAPDAVAGARARVLRAYESGPFEPERFAPWLGLVGAATDAGAVLPDPRVEAPSVSRVEALARCPWQALLGRLLQLEPTPDPLDALPGVDARMVGNVVHEVLERIAKRTLGSEPVDLETALRRAPVPLEWPDDAALEGLLCDVARAKIAEHRPPQLGYVRTIAAVARPFVERARALDEEERTRWPQLGFIGAEVQGRVTVGSGAAAVAITFRADAVERRGSTVILTDYKTGKAVAPSTFAKERLPRGEALQAMAYALAAGEGARGRYLYLGADAAKGEDPEVAVAEPDAHAPWFERAVQTLVGAWSAGAFYPRLFEDGDKEPAACKTCDYAQTCVRGDSGARRALGAIVQGTASERSAPALAALRAAWELSVTKREDTQKARGGERS